MPVACQRIADLNCRAGHVSHDPPRRRGDRPAVVIAACLIAAHLTTGSFGTRPATVSGAEPVGVAARGGLFESASSKQRREAVAAFPLDRLTPEARDRILRIAESPTIYRKLPTQSIQCDRDMFLFLTRNPEVLVGLWDLMGVTNVTVRRTERYKLDAQDGNGTTCEIDLIYGDSEMHVFVARGSYDGKLTTKPILGDGVFLIRSDYAEDVGSGTTVTGTLDCFVKFDGFGADLVARTLSGLIGKSADNNFVETARFISQISQASETNPAGMIDVARRLPQVEMPTKKQFAGAILTVAKRSGVGFEEMARRAATGHAARARLDAVPPGTAPSGTTPSLR